MSVPVAAQASPGESPTVAAREIVQRAQAGEAIDFTGATVEGDVDLRTLEGVAKPFRCVGCHFNGALRAADVIFERAVDLSHSVVAGSVELTGALFKDHVAFDETTFQGPVAAKSSRMLDGLSFAHGHFEGPVVFDGARLQGRSTFAGSVFDQEVSFRGTQFESAANFARASFSAIYFDDSVFSGRANFTLATFGRDAAFDGAEFTGGASFRAAEFSRWANFDHVSAAKNLSFDNAILKGGGDFCNITTSGSISMIEVVPQGELYMAELVARDLFMDVELIRKHVQGAYVKQRLLEDLEESAQARNALPVANHARFVRMSLAGRDKHGFERFADHVYCYILGYLVRPRQPFAVFWVLVFAAGLARALPELSEFLGHTAAQRARERQGGWGPCLTRMPAVMRWVTAGPRLSFAVASVGSGGGAGPIRSGAHVQEATAKTRSRPGVRGAAEAVSHCLYPLLHSLALACGGWAKSLSSAFGRRPDVVMEERNGPEYARAVVLWVEFLLYKGLIAVFLLALSNSNSTLRQILDSVWKS